MHSHLPPRLTGLKQRPFPHGEFCCLTGLQYYGLLRLLIRRPPGFRFLSLYQRLQQVRPADRMKPLLFQRLLSPHPALPTPEGSSRLLLQVLRRFPGLRFRLRNSAPSCSPLGANISTLQVSLDVTGCGFASPSQEVTSLQHLRSPRSTGCLLRGCLSITTTGLSPASRR
jgi:hypothetical protein